MTLFDGFITDLNVGNYGNYAIMSHQNLTTQKSILSHTLCRRKAQSKENETRLIELTISYIMQCNNIYHNFYVVRQKEYLRPKNK